MAIFDLHLRLRTINKWFFIFSVLISTALSFLCLIILLSVNQQSTTLKKNSPETIQHSPPITHETNIEKISSAAPQKPNILLIVSTILFPTTIILSISYLFIYPKIIIKPIESATRSLNKLSQGGTSYSRFHTPYKEVKDIDRALIVFQANAFLLLQRETVIADTLAELEETNKNLRTFVQVSSHDLKSPLRSVRVLCQLLSESTQNEDWDNVIRRSEQIELRTLQLEHLLDSLLDYVKLSKGPVAPTETNLSDMISEQINLLDGISNFTISIITEIRTIKTHKTWLAVTIRNLVDNAMKHHDLGAGSVKIKVNDRPGKIVLIVEDDGPGIPEMYQEKVFEPFQTLKPKHHLQSSGMGLAMLSRIITELGGDIKVDSPICNNRGSRFTVNWPKYTDNNESNKTY